MKRQLNTLLTLLIFVLAAPNLHAEDKQAFEPHEAWYVLKLGGQKAGHMHTRLYEEDGKLITKSDMVLAIKRGEAEMRIEQHGTFVETKDFKPIRSTSAMKLAVMGSEQTIDFTGDQWTVTSTNAGQKTETKMDPPKIDWLTPGGVAAYTRQAIERGDKEIKITTMDPSMGVMPVTVEMTRGESKDIEVFGRVIPATQWTVKMSAAPGIEIEQWTDEAGQPVKQKIPLMPGMEVEMLLADKQLATAKFDAPEMLAASFITPNTKIKNPRKLKRAVFELIAEDLKKNIGDTVPNAGYQSTEWVDDNTLRVTVELSKVRKGTDAHPGDSYLAATSMLNHEDKVIEQFNRQLLEGTRYVRGNGDEYTQQLKNFAETVRRFVREHIEAKDLSVGFASASETARTKQGDCTEHACLLAAMVRGAGIPSRTVTGLVYADQFAGREGIFGFHMWTQAWIETEDGKGYWLDLDAAMPGQVDGFDATHIALSTSAMKEGESFNDMVTMLPLMQGMEIKVIETDWAQ
jgi:hypothetical protein